MANSPTHEAAFPGLYLERPNRGWFGMKMKNGFAATAATARALVVIDGQAQTWLTFKMVTAGSTLCGGNTFSKLASRKVIGFVAEDAGIAGGATGAIAMCGPASTLIGPAAFTPLDFFGLSATVAGGAAVRASGLRGTGVICGYVVTNTTPSPGGPSHFVFPYRL